MELLETIKCKDGKLFNLEFHQARFDNARKEYFEYSDKIVLPEIIQIPPQFKKGLFRCRVCYSTSINKVEFLPHQYKKIECLKLIKDNSIDYHYKYSDRKKLNELYKRRGNCDDILIIKNACVTDSFTANPVFFDGVKWWTPDTPLLPGTQRAKLIEEGIILECKITPDDLSKYCKAGLINAMQDMEEMPIISIQNIIK